MSIQFLPPLESQTQILRELEKITETLSKPHSPKTKQYKRFLNSFTKSLFLVSKRKQPKKQPQPLPEAKQIKKPSRLEPIEIPKVPQSLLQQPKLPPMPPPPPAPLKPQPLPLEKGIISSLKEENGILTFDIAEPIMETKDWEIYTNTKEKIYQKALQNPLVLEDTNYLNSLIKESCKELKIKYSDDYIRKIKYYLVKNIKGYGKIDPLIRDSRVSSIICNSYNDLNVIFQGKQIPTSIKFDSNEELNNFIITLGDKLNKKLSDDNPTLDIKTPNLEVHALYNPITTSKFTIKKL